jgi:rubrerythrin
MSDLNPIDEVLDFAIEEEEKAAAFYTNLAEKMDHPSMKKVFLGFAREEMGHKAKLLAVKENKTAFQPADGKILDLKISEYLVDKEPQADMDYQDALIIAMKKEKAAFRLYTDLAASTEDEVVKATFLALAQEEAKHKLRFEVAYDDLLEDN